MLADNNIHVGYHLSDQEAPSLYFSFINNYVENLANSKKGIIFYNEDFIYGMLGDAKLLDEKEFKKFIEGLKKTDMELKYKSQETVSVGKKKIAGVLQFTIFHKFNVQALTDFFVKNKFSKI